MLASELSEIFNLCFKNEENTLLCTGASEPYYVPANTAAQFSCGTLIEPAPYARVFSRSDHAASVLHEVAHWCIAGQERRLTLDYGYWYEPDGRDQDKQAEFERVEVKPQALERIMSSAAGMPFRLSVDNASDPLCKPSKGFIDEVHQQTLDYLINGLPQRAKKFAQALDERFTQDASYAKLCGYVLSDLL
jgi:elongation factor P hydroxylase